MFAKPQRRTPASILRVTIWLGLFANVFKCPRRHPELVAQSYFWLNSRLEFNKNWDPKILGNPNNQYSELKQRALKAEFFVCLLHCSILILTQSIVWQIMSTALYSLLCHCIVFQLSCTLDGVNGYHSASFQVQGWESTEDISFNCKKYSLFKHNDKCLND